MTRTATPDDSALVRELWAAFEAEVPDHPWRPDDGDADLEHADLVLLADDGAGLAVVSRRGPKLWFLDLLYVRPEARGRGVAVELLREVATRAQAEGAEMLELEVLEHNDAARKLYERIGFVTVERVLAIAPAQLLAEPEGGPTFGRVHVQTDDVDAVAQTAAKVMPRFGGREGADVSGVHNGWVSVRSDVTDRDPAKLKALAKELSYTNGGVTLALGVEEGAVVRYTLYDKGSMVDEYASLPEYHGALPPGDVIALGANPTVLSRLTGAAPQRIREVARTAASPSDLPPALELYEQVAQLIGVEVGG